MMFVMFAVTVCGEGDSDGNGGAGGGHNMELQESLCRWWWQQSMKHDSYGVYMGSPQVRKGCLTKRLLINRNLHKQNIFISCHEYRTVTSPLTLPIFVLMSSPLPTNVNKHCQGGGVGGTSHQVKVVESVNKEHVSYLSGQCYLCCIFLPSATALFNYDCLFPARRSCCRNTVRGLLL